MNVSSFNYQEEAAFLHGQLDRGSRYWRSDTTAKNIHAIAPAPKANLIDREVVSVGEDVTEDISAVCQRQAQELANKLVALGVRIAFYDSRQAGWCWTDGIRSDRFKQLVPPLIAPLRVSNLHGQQLQSNLVLLSPFDDGHLNGQNSDVKQANTYRYVFRLGHAADGDEYLTIATEIPLTSSQQQSVIQRCHLLRDYLQACRVRFQRQAIELEQRLQKVQHQLRNPLAAIELFADTLILQLPSGELRKQAEAIQTTVRDLDERLSLIEANQQHSGHRHQYNIRDIALEAIAVLQHRWQAKQVCITVPEESTFAIVNRSQIKQVFENLLSNAIHFSPPSSVITCEWVACHQDISVKISDRGPGLSSEDIALAFAPHYSRRSGGKGLGLAIAKSFIHEHGGEIWCHSRPGGGAQFCFTLSSLAMN